MSQSRSMRAVNIDKFQSNLSPTAAVIMYYLAGDRAGAWVITKEHLQWTELGNPDTVRK